MIKLSRSLLSRNLPSEISGKSGYIKDALRLHSFLSRAGISTARHDFSAKGDSAVRVFAPYTIYKGKAALSIAPLLPTFTKLDSGDVRVQRNGAMMFTFWPAIGERKYDWEKRQKFALSPTEVGSLLNIGRHDSSEFFHDPSMLTSNAGQVRKNLSIKAIDDGSGYFFSLNVHNNILKSSERFSVPVTAAEFAVMKTACSFVLPHLMGWHRLTNELPSGTSGSSSKVDRRSLELEWDK